jgi:hypothetical protein
MNFGPNVFHNSDGYLRHRCQSWPESLRFVQFSKNRQGKLLKEAMGIPLESIEEETAEREVIAERLVAETI